MSKDIMDKIFNRPIGNAGVGKTYIAQKQLPHDLDEHIDNIDAAVFSGDSFTSLDNINVLQSFIDRWQRELIVNRRILKEEEEDELQNNS